MKKKIVILDRDGTVIIEKNHLTNVNDVELIPNAANAIKKMNDLGLGVIIVTNQTVVGNGQISLKELGAIHKKMVNLLAKEEATIDGIYFCPHKPEDNCSCRKPKLGLIEQAMKDYNFDPKECFMIGDKDVDIEFGKNAGATTILVRTGYGAEHEKFDHVKPDHAVDNLLATVFVIQQKLSRK